MKNFFQYRTTLKTLVALVVMNMVLIGCASNNLALRRSQSAKLALDAGWSRTALNAGQFSLISFAPQDMVQANTLTIYIEGDGLAWIDSSTPSFDPTPINPLALRLALRDPNPAVAYLARPCQYTLGSEQHDCSTRYWTSHRFAPEVIEASDLAVSQLKTRVGAQHIRLIGYSGGAAVAALVAARRNDVAMLVTVAGNLDHFTWTKQHGVSPLSGSLNASDYWQTLQHVPQQHYVGGRDDNINPSIMQSYASKFRNPLPSITVIPSYTHNCCWEENWRDLADKNFGLILQDKSITDASHFRN